MIKLQIKSHINSKDKSLKEKVIIMQILKIKRIIS